MKWMISRKTIDKKLSKQLLINHIKRAWEWKDTQNLGSEGKNHVCMWEKGKKKVGACFHTIGS